MLAKMINGRLYEHDDCEDLLDCSQCKTLCKYTTEKEWIPVFPNQDVKFNNIFPMQNGIMKGD